MHADIEKEERAKSESSLSLDRRTTTKIDFDCLTTAQHQTLGSTSSSITRQAASFHVEVLET